MKTISRMRMLLVVLIGVALAGCSAPTKEADIRLLEDRGLPVVRVYPRGATYPTQFTVKVGICELYIYKTDGRFKAPVDPFTKSTTAEITDPTKDLLKKIKAYKPCFIER